MFDQETLRPVIISMITYLIIAKFLPEIIKKPTGITIIDDLNMMLIAQKGSLSSGAILTGLITFITTYIIEKEFI
jgi:hypothetical protein